MVTKLVYVLVSNENDFFCEQAIMSVCSAKEHSPHTKITLVVDEGTDLTLKGHRSLLPELVDEKVVVDLHDESSNVFRSRILKTTLRKYIDGPFLFVDTDTIICRPLDDIDLLINQNVDIAAVPDAHCKYKEMTKHDVHKERSHKIGWNLENDEYHFNSGVMFVADNIFTRNFYNEWYKNWIFEKQFDLYFDQLALAYTNGSQNYPIKLLSGEWNCQIAHEGLYYFANAYIIHLLGGYHNGHVYFFNNLFPYKKIKEAGIIEEETLKHIKHPKSAFIGKALFLGNEDGPFVNSPFYTLFVYHKQDFKRLSKIVGLYLKLRSYFKKKMA